MKIVKACLDWLADHLVEALMALAVITLGFVVGLGVDDRAADSRVFVFSEERIPIVNRETGATEQKILLQYAIDGATYYAELDDEEELARYYEYLRRVGR